MEARFKLFTVSELFNRETTDWLIKGLFRVGALIGLYGPPAEGKSFLALDWALSIAQGSDWLGRRVCQGDVVYVAAEGGSSIAKRIAAWMKHRGVSQLPSAFFILEGVQVKEPEDLDEVVARLNEKGIRPRLIVLDTLARCFVGGDENSAKEMGEFIDGLVRLQRDSGSAAVIVLHHTGKSAKDMERGSTAFRAAVDVMIRVEKQGHRVTVSNNKQKDDDQFEPVRLQLHQVAVGQHLEDAATSCVLGPLGEKPNAMHSDTQLPAYLHPTLAALAGAPDSTATRKEWIRRAAVAERTLDSHREALVQTGHVQAGRKRGTFMVTAQGQVALMSAASATHLQLAIGNSVPSEAAALATTP